MPLAVSGSRSEVGSSRNRILGSSASARANAARLTMPPESSDGKLDAGVGRQAGKRQLHRRDPFLLFGRQIGVLAHRQHDVLRHRQRREQRALLEQHADQRRLFRRAERLDRLAVEQHLAGVRPVQADERLEQHRLARSRAAGDADDFAGHDVEADLVVHHLLAEAVDDAARGEDRLGDVARPARS